ncbi:hypothetical protein PROFUN_02869 [Planoprotostelium fungivorum]|uniref:Uncharacterized protein n=1 Tax=Planoprotostelium fungivorum TaxID=1890364 RepID=A0A2P6NS24_9EUKA|nr:hypothetical protein PROFUN_02869 [Planoprotostelium fungivorum]
MVRRNRNCREKAEKTQRKSFPSFDPEISQDMHIEKQEALAIDYINRNGRSTDLHIVVKTCSFQIDINTGGVASLYTTPLNVELVYDSDPQKKVDAVKSTPIESVTHVNSHNGHRGSIEIKINVLSSQHEGAFFLIHLWLCDEAGKTHTVHSAPVKVVSKKSQAKKISERAAPNEPAAPIKTNNSSPEPIKQPTDDTSLSPPSAPTSNINELTQSIRRLEAQQAQLISLLGPTTKKNELKRGAPSSDVTFEPRPLVDDSIDDEFQMAFHTFMSTFRNISAEERPKKIRKLARHTTGSDREALDSFCSIYQSSVSSDQIVNLPSPVVLVSNWEYEDNLLDDFTKDDYSYYERDDTTTNDSSQDEEDVKPAELIQMLSFDNNQEMDNE